MKAGIVRSLCLVLVVAFVGTGAPRAATGAAALPACKDRAYTLNGTHWTTALKWSFAAATTPKNLRKADVTRRLVRAARTVAAGRNRCGLAGNLSARQRYLGRTTARPNIRRNGTCGRPDDRNEVGFGALPSGEMALTCYWSRDGSTIEADIVFNRADYRWVTKVPPGCAMAWDVQAVATHEFGHAFGLGHVPEGLHANLTMAPYILPCQASESRLGLGDLRGLRAEY